MRRVVLPRAREIGQALLKIKNLYEPGKRGPGGKASAFYADCKAVAGLGKSQAAGYIRIATDWHRLVDYMTDLPEGAEPVLSLGAALNAIAEMNKAARPALPGTEAVDVDAEPVAATAGTSARRTRFARSTKRTVVDALTGLLVTPVGRRHEGRIRKVMEELKSLLQTLEAEEEAGAPADEWTVPEEAATVGMEEATPEQPRSYDHPQAAPAPAAVAEEATEEPAPEEGQVSLVALFPLSDPAESFEAMTDLVTQHGSGIAAAASVGCALSSFKNHKSRLKKLIPA
jgi:hypothetical protein